MEEVQIISTSLVVSNTDNNISNIDMTPWDLQFLLLETIQKGLLFYKPTHHQQETTLLKSSSTTSLIQHLKTSLARTLHFYPPLAGRLSTVTNADDATLSFFINCNNAGVEFTHAVAPKLTVETLLESYRVPSIVHSLFPLNNVINIEGVSKPLLGVQITELIDGYFIGCSMNHCLGDGTRSRLNPPLLEGYFGNAIYIKQVKLTAGELLGNGLGWAAMEINKTVNSQNPEEVVKIYKGWAENPLLLSKNSAFVGNKLGISSTPRHNIYRNDFGWGKPVAVRSGIANKKDGKVTLFPGVEEGSVDIEVSVLPETMQALENDTEFMEAVTN